ncbi:acyl-CoA thioesterase [Acidisoma cellulosilytica]|uniref:Acyl-CoA thioesterase n=1 Tax=Acidisoma cellulosilyticum TaxID=2802395 RepID=A0A964E6A9_9PROT|nr:thioesterase family protein [Acidisoma cellulosilyticum]MCB8883307.1 acyl-CoA thioesterase [Acidisoma cellulosilyticum]
MTRPPDMDPEYDPTLRETYRVWAQERVRYSDTDAQGHVNNVAYFAYLETGRTTLAQTCGLPIGLHNGMHTVLARVEIDYRAEVHWPATLDLGSAVVKLGRSSATIIQGIFHGDRCVAMGREVIVMVETATGLSTPIPDDLRQRLIETAGLASAWPEN